MPETKEPPEGFRDEFALSVSAGFSNKALCEKYGASRRTVQRWKAWLKERQQGVENSSLLPSLGEPPRLDGDWMVVSDTEIPAHDEDTLAMMVAVAMRFGIRNLILNGDAFVFDEFSRWMQEVALSITLEQEIEAAKKVFVDLLKWFQRIVWVMGNHDVRLNKATLGSISPAMLMNHVGGGKLEISQYHYCIVEPGWLISHPDKYSQIPGSVARRVESIERMDVICAHTHILSMSRDPSDTHWCVDGGCATRAELRPWKRLHVDGYPKWNRGFVMLRNGRPYLFHTETADWDFWLEAGNGEPA